MKLSSTMRIALAAATAVVLMAVGSAQTGSAASTTPALNPEVVLRPLTSTDKTQYGLASLQGANGLSAIGIGQPAYLEALVNIAYPSSDILQVTWSLTKPTGSAADLADSPLGPNVPTFKMMDRLERQVVGRKFLRPDVTGQYSVTATITTTTSTNSVTQNISAAMYMGADVCKLCHSGGAIAQNIYPTWTNTAHATFFTKAIDGLASDHYGKNCISSHTAGYDANTNAVNNGFDDVATRLGWTFPSVLTNGNWAAMPPELKSLGNIQCENCHGPGSEHAYAFGNTNLSNWPRVDINYGAGNCGQCHDAMTHHFKNGEWNNSRHAIATSHPSGPGEEACVRCHTGIGFVGYIKGASSTNTTYEAIGCAACHDPHDAKNPHQLRTKEIVQLMDNKTTVTVDQAGNGIVCMNCHISRRDAVTYVETTTGNNRFGPHHGPQTDMLLGVNAVNYGKVIPSSAHRDVVEDTCVTCHMQEAETTPAFTHAGGHTFNMAWEGDASNAPVQMTRACVECHGPISSFDFARQDYDGNGLVEGVQTEVRGLLTKLTKLLPCGEIAPGNHTPTSLNISSSWTKQQLRAAYNYLFVVEDGSWGVHNLSYTVGILKASITDLGGDLNNDGLADNWQIKYFGSTSSPNAAPNACPAGDGIPNWAKYAMGLDPTVPGTAFPGGVVWASGSKLYSGTETNSLKIYTAAEIAFNSEAGKTYQIQAISAINGTWQNIGLPIPGTGNTISYVTPTRSGVQQYYRVQILP